MSYRKRSVCTQVSRFGYSARWLAHGDHIPPELVLNAIDGAASEFRPFRVSSLAASKQLNGKKWGKASQLRSSSPLTITASPRKSRALAGAQAHDPSLGCTHDRARAPESACHAAMAGAQWREMAGGAGAETPDAETPERMGVTRA